MLVVRSFGHGGALHGRSATRTGVVSPQYPLTRALGGAVRAGRTQCSWRTIQGHAMMPHWFLLLLLLSDSPAPALYVVQGSNGLALIMQHGRNCTNDASLGGERVLRARVAVRF